MATLANAGTNRATRMGFGAIVLWGMMALFSTAARRLPPFQLLASTFAVASVLGLARAALFGNIASAFRLPWRVWLLGVGGLFGFHAFYFTALAKAPVVHASLISYLWPLLIVLLAGSGPLRTRLPHLAGAALGMIGVTLLVARDGQHADIQREHVVGYLAALASAFTWAGYSVTNRRFANVPVDAVTGFFMVTAALGFLVHAATEPTVIPSAREAMVVVALGLGPMGAAFFLWDYGTKHGDLRMLGVVSYATPLLSTLLLIACGIAHFSWSVALACVFVTGGAWVASRTSRAFTGAPPCSEPRGATPSTRDAVVRR